VTKKTFTVTHNQYLNEIVFTAEKIGTDKAKDVHTHTLIAD